MPIDYGFQVEDASKVVKAKGSNLRVSYKNTFEVASAVKGMSLTKAKEYLARVLKHDDCIPYNRHTKGVGRTGQTKLHKGTSQGRWPEKSVKLVQSMLQNAESNADIQSIDAKTLVIHHIACQKAPKNRRRTYRAHGRIGPYMASPLHIELILKPKGEEIKRADSGATYKQKKLVPGATVESQ